MSFTPRKPGLARKETAMSSLPRWFAVAAVAVGMGFASTAEAAPPPVVKVQPTVGGGYLPGYVPGGYVPGYIPGGYIPGGYIPQPLPPRVDYDYVVIYQPSIFAPWRV